MSYTRWSFFFSRSSGAAVMSMPPKQGTKKRAKPRPIGDPNDPEGFGVWASRFLEWMRVRNYSVAHGGEQRGEPALLRELVRSAEPVTSGGGHQAHPGALPAAPVPLEAP